ncbi:MAG: hypothetical protein CEE38_01885 [Planctomycetes bacterium B3_Pla]|nr:MAG: hypothetical protein CEE38_01885 [Planctomycetes bacterium B3_Pla]
MNYRRLIITVLCCVCFALVSAGKAVEEEAKPPAKVYVPYKDLTGVFEQEDQGVFLPYKEFQRLWRSAQDKPAAVSEAPFEYLISTARFHGDVKAEIAVLRLDLTIDILRDGWIQVPLGLGEVAVSDVKLTDTGGAKVVPLLRVVNGRYMLVTRGKGRYVLALDFARQLETQPGLAVLKYRIPSAAITTLELLIPEENLKVDVQPMLAATTSQVEAGGAKVTRLQAFLGSSSDISLSWKPTTEAAAELEPVIICEQFQHIDVAEALISHQVAFDYNIHRGGVDSFTIRLPGEFRITDVSGANIAKWDIEAPEETDGSQKLEVKLFSAAQDKYQLAVKMERFVQEAQAEVRLAPIATEQVLRRSGLIGITTSPRRSVRLDDAADLARVDTGQLPQHLQNRPRVTAYRFITSDYAGTIVIGTTSPRITVDQRWMLGVDSDRLELHGRLRYKVERTGVFELNMNLPEPWEIETVGPEELVDDYQLKGEGQTRTLHILLRREKIGVFELRLTARAERTEPQGLVDFALPLADANDLQSYQGQLMLLLADHLRAEVQDLRQLQAMPLRQAERWTNVPGLSPVMAFEFRAIDRRQSGGAAFKVDVKPVQVSATVHRLVNIQPGSIEQEAVVQYRIRYAPLDTFYLKMPVELADSEVQITGSNIKEKPRIDELPIDQRVDVNDPNTEDVNWAYFKIVLQSNVTGNYQLKVHSRRSFGAGRTGQVVTVEAEPILAAGRLSDQNGHIAVAKADTFAIGEPVIENLIPADAGSSADLPYAAHRRIATLAFKYNAPPFELSLPVALQKEATVFTTIVSGAIIEQVFARDGVLNTHAIYLLVTSQGDRLPITLPSEAQLSAVLLNGNEAPVEKGVSSDELIVRLPPSAGQVSRFVLEISYGLKNVSASNLAAPALPEEIPIQQTLWRLWIPKDYYLLWHERVFSAISPGWCHNILQRLSKDQPIQAEFKLPGQGKNFNFIRQGAPGRLSIVAARKEIVAVVVWILIVAAGALMLRLRGFHRVLIVLAAAFVVAIVHLFTPLLVDRIVSVGWFAAFLVLLLWIAHWGFIKLPKLRQIRAGARQKVLKQAPDKRNTRDERRETKE